MKDADKIHAVSRLLGELQMLNTLYAKDGSTVYFDYDAAIEQLHRAKNIITESVRASRPADLPEDIPWCEAMGNDEIGPYVYTGDMSVDDFFKMQKLIGL